MSVGNRVGEVGGGTLSLMKLAREVSGDDGQTMLTDPALRERLADWYVQSEGLRFTGMRALTALSKGQMPGPENSVAKLVMATLAQDLANCAVELEDQFGIIAGPDAMAKGAFQSTLLNSPGMRIAGGTDEILRNIIAERVLGMPADIRVDKTVPFKDLPVGR
jgi:alkylation response protein AidB-like acyl-CoA dehydrogenase